MGHVGMLRRLRRIAVAVTLGALAWPSTPWAQLSNFDEKLLSGQFLPGDMIVGLGKFRYIIDFAAGGFWAYGNSGHYTQLPDGANPREVALWKEVHGFVVTEPGIGKIAIIKYKTGSLDVDTITQIPIPGLGISSPGTLWAGADGNIYISTGNGGIVQVTPDLQVHGGTILQPSAAGAKASVPWVIPTPEGAAGPPSALNFADGPDGNVWFTETFPTDGAGNPIVTGKEKIGRVTPAGVITEFTVPTTFAGLGSTDKTTGTYITAGTDGNVWFKESTAGKVGKITPAGVVTEYPLPVSGTILGILAGPDGNLWVKAYNNKIYRMTPTGTVAAFAIPTTSFGRDVELVLGTDGAIWFVEDTKIGSITTAGVITEYSLPTPTFNGTPIYPFQLSFAPDGTGGFLEYTDNNVATFTAPPTASGAILVVEFYNRSLDHYFISTNADEISDLDTGVHAGWQRTGLVFNAYPSGQAGASPVCRFYIPPALGDSHFFGRGTDECNSTAQKNPTFDYESPEVMDMVLPAAGVCPAATAPVYRVFSNRADANHRYTTVRSVRDQMVARGWLAEGDGPDLVVMCAPQ